MKVSNVPAGTIDKSSEALYNGLWIGMGLENGKNNASNPSTQFEKHDLPPRKSSDLKDAIHKLKVLVKNNQPMLPYDKTSMPIPKVSATDGYKVSSRRLKFEKRIF